MRSKSAVGLGVGLGLGVGWARARLIGMFWFMEIPFNFVVLFVVELFRMRGVKNEPKSTIMCYPSLAKLPF